MKLKPVDIEKLERFLSRIREDVYSEMPSELHQRFTTEAFKILTMQYDIQGPVLDVGCGPGSALELFRNAHIPATGITLSSQDLAYCKDKGFDVSLMDQSFLDYEDTTFGMVWCRHCLEHSFMPYFTLSEFNRVMKQGGYLYVEVPAPNTIWNHQENPNHYSVFQASMWKSLIAWSGFALLSYEYVTYLVLSPEKKQGMDGFFSFIAYKPRAEENRHGTVRAAM